MCPRFVFLVFLGIFFCSCVQGANILAVFSFPSPSHLIVEMSVAKVLAENGHNVTVVTSLKPHVTHKNIHHIFVKLTEEEERKYNETMADLTQRDNTDVLAALLRMRDQLRFCSEKNRDVMKDPRVVNLYENKDNKFDLVMIGYFMNNFQMGIAQKLKVPVMLVSSVYQWEPFYSMLGNPRGISYIPFVNILVGDEGTMTFTQRVENVISWCFKRIFTYTMDKDNAEIYYELYGDDPNMPRYEEINKNVSLAMFNAHDISEGPIRANVPAVIDVGGIQVKDTPDPLPKNIAEFLNNSTDGAILLSLGSNIQGTFISRDTVQKMFNVLSKLKQRIIWKWEDLDNTPGKSDNILYSKWLPQDDILAHPKVVLFINHAGRGGITESQYHGKPMLSLPVFGDQPMNADKMVDDGFGLSMNLLTLEEKPFQENILEILENPKYTQKVQTFSKLFRDRPMTARQTVLYWTEYVLRHHGAPHLQSPLKYMSFIEANNLDIYALLLIIFAAVVVIIKLILQLICRKPSGQSRNTKKHKKTKTK